MVKILPSDIDYPDWNFSSQRSIASEAGFGRFNPASNSSDPFESSSSPNLEPKKKTIIISDDAYRQGFSSFDIAKILHVLKQDGFEIKLALNDGNGGSYLADLDDQFEFLDKKSGKKINIFSDEFDLKKELYSITSSNSDPNKEQKLTQFRSEHNLNADETLVMNWHQTHELDKLYSKPLIYEYNLLSNAYGHNFTSLTKIDGYLNDLRVKKIVNSDDLKITIVKESCILSDGSTNNSAFYDFRYLDINFNDDEKQKISNALLSALTVQFSTTKNVQLISDTLSDVQLISDTLLALKSIGYKKKLDSAILDKLMDTFIENGKINYLIQRAQDYSSVHFRFLDNEKYRAEYCNYLDTAQTGVELLSPDGKITKELKDFEISENYDGIMSLLTHEESNISHINLLSEVTIKEIAGKLVLKYTEDA